MNSRFRAGAAVLAAVAVFALAGCGGEDDPAPSTPGSGADPGPSATATGAAPAPADDCGGAADAVKAFVAGTELQSVETTSQCSLVVIKTSLGDADGTRAKEICDAASKVAYTGDVGGIRVEGSSGKELSQGIESLPCLASP